MYDTGQLWRRNTGGEGGGCCQVKTPAGRGRGRVAAKISLFREQARPNPLLIFACDRGGNIHAAYLVARGRNELASHR